MTANLKRFSQIKLVSFALLGCLLLAVGGVWGVTRFLSVRPSLPGVATKTPGPGTPSATPEPQLSALKLGEVYSMALKLSEGQAQPQAFETLLPATGEPLSPEEIAEILARLPALPTQIGDQTDFKLPADVLPPPRPGKTVSEQFPPLETAPTPDLAESGPLQVLRYAPEGEIPLAPFISVTFNQAMVPLGTLADLAAEAVPVKIEPELPGTWRWLGTKTLTFEYDSALIDRLPKATAYTVTVPAGIKSATGGVLAEPVTWTFTTPAPKVVTTYPYSDVPQPLEPLFFVAFDQRIDPGAVLETIQVVAGSRSARIILASAAEIEKNETVSQMVKNTPEGRWLAFRAAEAFEPETGITVSIGPGTPSAEAR